MAERAMTAGDSDSADYPPVARRIREALQRVGMSAGDLSERCGVGRTEYWDLELHDSELFECVDIDHLPTIANTLQLSLMSLLFGASPTSPIAPVTYRDLAARVLEEAQRSGQTLDQFGEAIGWDITGAVQQPEMFGEFNLVGLFDVCSAVDYDWVAVLAWLEERGGQAFVRFRL